MNSDKFSFKSRLASFKFAFRGLWSLVKTEHNSRIHILAAILAISLGFLLKINVSEWNLIIIVIGLVFITEILNSSLENLADLIDPGWNQQIEKSKDYAAAAVLVSAIIAITVGCMIFIPKMLALIK